MVTDHHHLPIRHATTMQMSVARRLPTVKIIPMTAVTSTADLTRVRCTSHMPSSKRSCKRATPRLAKNQLITTWQVF